MTEPNDVLVDLQGIGKRYQRGAHVVAVLNDLNLRVARGEFVAFIGPSGSGKSTC